MLRKYANSQEIHDMIEELNLKGKWWLPDKSDEIFEGNLTLNHQHRRALLSIISGPHFEMSEMGNRARTKHDIILGETFEGQKVTLNDCEQWGWRSNLNDIKTYSIAANNILVGAYFKRPDEIIFRSIYVTYRGDQVSKWIKRFGTKGLFRSNKSENYVKYYSHYTLLYLVKKNKY